MDFNQNQTKNKFLHINGIPRTFIDRVFVKNGKTSILIKLPLSKGTLEFWVPQNYIFTDNYTLNFNLSIAETFKYKIVLNGKESEISGTELYNLIQSK